MKLKKIKLKNFRLFKDFELEIPESNSVVLVGINGAGKTTILDAIALSFTHFTGRLKSSKKTYGIDSWFTKDDIAYDAETGKVEIEFSYKIKSENDIFNDDNNLRKISIFKNKNKSGFQFDIKPEQFIEQIENLLKNNKLKSIPIVAYYNVNRTCSNNIGKKSKTITYNNKLLAYENALNLKNPNFAYFEKWFIEQNNLGNALKVERKDLNYELPSLKNVKKAFIDFINFVEPDVYSNISVFRESIIKNDFSETVNEYLSLEKNNVRIKFSQLSFGEKMIIGLVCEIARRLTIANENSEEALNGEGIVLIDELDLHLHPNWQLKINSALNKVFPNIQFIFSTHSPLILSGLRKESIIIIDEGKIINNEELPDIYSATSDEILNRLLNSKDSNDIFSEEKKELDTLFNELKFDEAKVKLAELKKKVNSSPQWLIDYEQRLDFATL